MLALGTFETAIAANLWTGFMDNQVIERGVLKGSGGGPEVNEVIGRFWSELARARVGFQIFRVESKANVADGPSRGMLADMRQLNASFQVPCMPVWCLDPWTARPSAPILND